MSKYFRRVGVAVFAALALFVGIQSPAFAVIATETNPHTVTDTATNAQWDVKIRLKHNATGCQPSAIIFRAKTTAAVNKVFRKIDFEWMNTAETSGNYYLYGPVNFSSDGTWVVAPVTPSNYTIFPSGHWDVRFWIGSDALGHWTPWSAMGVFPPAGYTC